MRPMKQWILCAALVGLITQRADGVIISTGDGSGNTALPAGPVFANVGSRTDGMGNFDATAIYLGDGWVLTANHVGAGPVYLDGNTYFNVPGSQVQLTNFQTPGKSQFTDLLMYRISGDPGLPRLTISETPPSVGSEVTMIGRGRNREPNLTYWNASWVEVTPPPPATFSGYKTTSDATIRWGTNAVHQTGHWINDGSDVLVLTTRFDSVGTAYEGQVVRGDSGGGFFYLNPSTSIWELAGTIVATGTLNGQPQNTAVFTDLSYAADLSAYRDQILTINPLPGDLNLDFVVDIFDINEVSANWGGPGPAGDANKDGVVDIFDINFISSHWTASGGGAGFAAGLSAVPEPMSVALLVAGLLLLVPLWLRRRIAASR